MVNLPHYPFHARLSNDSLSWFNEWLWKIMAEKILIVDDDVDSLKLIGLMLKRQGYEVTVADSGGKALSKADAEIPNLIIFHCNAVN